MAHTLIPLDGSPLAETILPFVESLTRRCRGRVTLLYVAPEGDAAASTASMAIAVGLGIED